MYLIGFSILLVIELSDITNLGSLLGLLAFILMSILISNNPRQIKLQPILGGLFLQFALGLFVIRSSFGYQLFKSIGDKVQDFLYLTDHGTMLVFGPNLTDHFVAFKVWPF
jgi:pyrimidine nucleoside transport protein